MQRCKKYAVIAMLIIGMKIFGRNEYVVQANEQTVSAGILVEECGKIYYLYPDGTFAKDWVAIESDWYFFQPFDGSMAIDTSINGFLFGKDGKFIGIESTIKKQQLKDVVDHILSSIIREDMSEEEKINMCYMFIINNASYKRTYDTPLGDWTGDYALQLLTTCEGNCYRYASAFAYLMTRLGYESKVITGEVVARKGGTTPHAWTEVKIGDEWYIFDTELQDANGNDYYKKTYETYPTKPLIKMVEWEICF